jgi:hypothetical protein
VGDDGFPRLEVAEAMRMAGSRRTATTLSSAMASRRIILNSLTVAVLEWHST